TLRMVAAAWSQRGLAACNPARRRVHSTTPGGDAAPRIWNDNKRGESMDLRRSTALAPYLPLSSAISTKVNSCGGPLGGQNQQQVRLYRSSSQYNIQHSGQQQQPSGSGNWWSKVIGVSAAGYAVMKLKGLKILIPVLKFSKAGPLLSMCVSTLAYGAVFGWQFGTGMVGLIFIHELGHALMMRRLGVPTGPMVFIPFMGASVEMRKHPSSGEPFSAILIRASRPSSLSLPRSPDSSSRPSPRLPRCPPYCCLWCCYRYHLNNRKMDPLTVAVISQVPS
ncbi:PtdIns(3,5)P(2) sythesis regulation factor, partial [Perkinsus olseni]